MTPWKMLFEFFTAYVLVLNIKDEEYYLLLDFREKMVGVNLYDGNIGASELWLERVILSRCQRISTVIRKKHTVFITRAVECRRQLLKLGGTTDCNESP